MYTWFFPGLLAMAIPLARPRCGLPSSNNLLAVRFSKWCAKPAQHSPSRDVSSSAAAKISLRRPLIKAARPLPAQARGFAFAGEEERRFKVALLGASQGSGPALSLLLAQSPFVSQLRLYDAGASQAPETLPPAHVIVFNGLPQLADCLADVDMVIIAQGSQARPGMSREEVFSINARAVKSMMISVARHCPKAWIHLLTDPLNSIVPMAANVLRSYQVFDPAKLFGVTKVNSMLAGEYVARLKGLNPKEIEVPVVGGHEGMTVLPFLSKTRPFIQFSEKEVQELTPRIQAGTPDPQAHAFAAAWFLDSCLRARSGQEDIFDFALVQNAITRVDYFATRVKLCPSGVQYVVGKDFINMSKYEDSLYTSLLPVLKENIYKGLSFTPKHPVVP